MTPFTTATTTVMVETLDTTRLRWRSLPPCVVLCSLLWCLSRCWTQLDYDGDPCLRVWYYALFSGVFLGISSSLLCHLHHCSSSFQPRLMSFCYRFMEFHPPFSVMIYIFIFVFKFLWVIYRRR